VGSRSTLRVDAGPKKEIYENEIRAAAYLYANPPEGDPYVCSENEIPSLECRAYARDGADGAKPAISRRAWGGCHMTELILAEINEMRRGVLLGSAADAAATTAAAQGSNGGIRVRCR
jgi:hypothetical protein